MNINLYDIENAINLEKLQTKKNNKKKIYYIFGVKIHAKDKTTAKKIYNKMLNDNPNLIDINTVPHTKTSRLYTEISKKPYKRIKDRHIRHTYSIDESFTTEYIG